MRPLDNHTVSELTAALEGMDGFVFLETSKLSTENYRSFLFTEPLHWLECTSRDDPSVFLQHAEEYRAGGYYLAGWLGYEFGYLLEPAFHSFVASLDKDMVVARLGVFRREHVFDHASESFLRGEGWPVGEDQQKACKLDNLQTNISRQEFLADIKAIKRYILAGDTYQVNYTFKLDFMVTGSAAALYRQLRENQSVAYGAWIRCGGQDIMSFSPELFFSADQHSVRVRPMKGTLSRGLNREKDFLRAEKLCHDAKSRSENVMIVDLIRNDLARLLHDTGGGRVKVQSLFDVEAYETLLQMTSTIVGIPKEGRRLELIDMFKALFPCGSVTGAPKIRTMEIIRELEKEPRGVYCGAIGFCAGDEMCFNVPIRTLTLADNKGCMGIGAGIVHDSDPESEWRECLLKGHFLTHSRPDFQLIETLCWQPDNGYWLLQEHLERLRASAEYFFFQADIEDIRNRLAAEAELFTDNAMRVRVLLFKDGRLEVNSVLLPSVASREELPKVSFSASRVEEEDVFLYHKTTFRGLYNQEREKAICRGLYEILFLNTRGQVTEGTISTLFVEKDGRLFTPPLSSGLLPGTYRRFCLDSGKAEEKVLTMKDVTSADALYVANSVRGLVLVQLVEQQG